MTTNKVEINRNKYRDVYENIIWLIRSSSKSLGNSLHLSLKNGHIVQTLSDRENEYILSGSGDEEQVHDFKLDKDGATWFSSFRNQATSRAEQGQSDFRDLITEISATYHKKYGFLEFREIGNKADDETKQNDIVLIQNVLEKFIIWPKNAQITPIEETWSANTDVFAVTLRIQITIENSGQPKAFIGRLYFRYVNNRPVLVPGSDAEAYQAEIDSKINDSDASPDRLMEPNLVRMYSEQILHKISDLISKERNDDSVSFLGDYLVFGKDSGDAEALKHMKEGDDGELISDGDLICKKIESLGFYHLSWKPRKYRISVNKRNLYDVQIGLGDVISVFCSKCCNEGHSLKDKEGKLYKNENGVLISENHIRFDVDDKTSDYFLDIQHKGDSYDIALKKVTVDDNGEEHTSETGGKEIDAIKEHVFSRHNQLITDCSSKADSNCFRYCCEKETEFFESNGRKIPKCKDCPFMDVVFRPYGEKPMLANDCAYVQTFTGQYRVVDRKKVVACKWCGKEYEKNQESENTGLCYSCMQLQESDKKSIRDELRNVYEAYSSFVPALNRLIHLNAFRAATAEERYIYIRIGNKLYLMDKAKIMDERKFELDKPITLKVKRKEVKHEEK